MVVVPHESSDEPFRLQSASMPDMKTLQDVTAKRTSAGLQPKKGLKLAAAKKQLLKDASETVIPLTRVLDGFCRTPQVAVSGSG
jgi:hypothetical protein